MIAMRIEGRLGNQLFQYAFIIAASKELNTSFYIDRYVQPSLVDKYFDRISANSEKAANWLFDIKGYKNTFNFYLRRFYYKSLGRLLGMSVLQYSFTTCQTDVEIRNKSIYQGYFQSELFFKPVEKSIRDKFVIKDELVKEFNTKYGELYKNNTIVTIHIRRTDYHNLPNLNLGSNDLTLPLSYYQKAISKYDGQSVHFVFISDDVAFVEDNFKHIQNKTISADDEIMDFQHLLNADSCIISNSTFSWWGAWLNGKKNKKVYCPQYFMGYHLKKEVPDKIYPDGWEQIEF